jgi:hypothetical protein
MKVIDDGVIKYDRSNFSQCGALLEDEFGALEYWRKKLYQMNFIGEYPEFHIGFGNMSTLRDYSCFQKSAHPQFVITGTQTGKYADLNGQELLRLHASEELCEYDKNQGARIKAPEEITEKMANKFFCRFWGRQDVYAKRNEKKDTGETSYFSQCNNFWTEVCYRKQRKNVSCNDCKYRSYTNLTKKDILMHLRGKSYNASDVIGVYPLLTDGTSRFLVFDFDNHQPHKTQK